MVVAAEKSSEPTATSAPSMSILNPPAVMAFHVPMVCSALVSAPPYRMADVSALAQRPIISVKGCGDWPKYRAAAAYSGAFKPKSVATDSSVVYDRTRSRVSIMSESPATNRVPKPRRAAATGDRLMVARTRRDTDNPVAMILPSVSAFYCAIVPVFIPIVPAITAAPVERH